jgi:hypothetical protein
VTFTMYGRTLLLRSVFTADVVTVPASLEVALTNTVPPANSAEDQLVEPDSATTNYVRQTYALTSVQWAPSGFGDLYNTLKISYPQVGSPAWGVLNGWALVDPVSGQCVNAGALLEPIATVTGMIPFLDPGTLVLGIAD